MEGLRTPRVVVIDDRLDEAAPLLRVLATLGVPAQNFTGNQQELPAAPFAGIRLLSRVPALARMAPIGALSRSNSDERTEFWAGFWSGEQSRVLKQRLELGIELVPGSVEFRVGEAGMELSQPAT